MGWHAFPDHARRVLFFWSQKAACTTLFRMLADNRENAPPRKRFFINHSLVYPRHLPHLDAGGYRSVIVVRHPISRMVSAYLNTFVVHYGTPIRTHKDMEPFARDLHLDICAAAGREPGQNLTTFEEFIDAVARAHLA